MPFHIRNGVRTYDVNTRSPVCCFIHKDAGWDRHNQVFRQYSGVLVLSGNGEFVSTEGVHYDLHRGCFFQRIPDRPHTTLVFEGEEWTEICFNLPSSLYRSLVSTHILSSNDVLYPGVPDGIMAEAEKLTLLESASLEIGAPELFAREIPILQRLTEAGRIHAMNEEEQRMEQAYIMLCSDLEKELTGKTVAMAIGMGYENFRKLFVKYYNISPGRLRIEQRIEASKAWLQIGLPVKQVADMFGYCDEFAFSKQFKSIVGLSPRDFCNPLQKVSAAQVDRYPRASRKVV